MSDNPYAGQTATEIKKNKKAPKKTLWQRMKERGKAALGEIPTGFKPQSTEIRKVKDIGEE